MAEVASDGDTEQGTPTVWDNAWREGHAHGVARALGIPYHEAWQRTAAMLAGKPWDAWDAIGTHTQNKSGKWVPSIPVPFYSWFPHFRCPECQAAYWTRKGYEGHYARDHILEAA